VLGECLAPGHNKLGKRSHVVRVYSEFAQCVLQIVISLRP
jgi:hypothetical protein